jgi:predicted NACHT family NTPase
MLLGKAVAPLTSFGLEALDGEAFLERWCGALFSENPASSAKHLAELSGALRARVEIRRMARNPVMLTALAVVHWNERRLPEQRADLYESILIWLARSREQSPDRPTAERCLMLLQQLARAMQNATRGRAVQVSKGWAADALAPYFREVPEPERLSRAQDFLEQEEVDSGIIVSRASDVAFRHLTFQEYLAAKAVSGMADAAQQELLLAAGTIYKPEWREVVLLLGGVLYRQGLEKVDGLVSALLEKLGQHPSLAPAPLAGRRGALRGPAGGHGARPAAV